MIFAFPSVGHDNRAFFQVNLTTGLSPPHPTMEYPFNLMAVLAWGAIEAFSSGKRYIVRFHFPNGRKHLLCNPGDPKKTRNFRKSLGVLNLASE